MLSFLRRMPSVSMRRLAVVAGAAVAVTAALLGQSGFELVADQDMAGFGWGTTEP